MLRPLISRRGVIGGAGFIAASLPAGASAIDLKDFGAREGQNIAPALVKALQQGDGAAVTIGPGEYRLDSPFIYLNRDRLKTSSRGPGLVLIGSGSQRTIIECTHSGEAGLEVGQEQPYRFTVGGRIEGLTLRGNPKAQKQDGLRLSGAWDYEIADVEVTGFTGNGISMPWREDLRWELDGVEITAGSKIARRPTKDGFTDGTGLSGTLRIFGAGIPPGATIERLIDDKSLEMSVPATETAIRTLQFVGNSDAFQSIVEIKGCRLMANGGWGLWGGAGIGAVVSWITTESALNGAGGVFCAGNAWSLVGGAIYANEGHGLIVDRVNGGPVMFRAERIEFDSNTGSHVWLKEINTASFERCRFITHYLPAKKVNWPEIGLIIGNTPATRVARSIEVKGCQFRAPSDSAANYSAFVFGASGGYRHIDIIDPAWILRAPHHTLLGNAPQAEANILIREDGITSYASRTPRAWAILERGVAQTIPSAMTTELVFDRVQGELAGGATPQRLVTARAVGGTDELQIPSPVPGLKVGAPVSDLAGRMVPGGCRITSVTPAGVKLSSPANSDGEFTAVIGGIRVPYAQLYEIDGTIMLQGAASGASISLALTVDGRTVRQSIAAAGAAGRQTVSLRALLPLPAGASVGLRLTQDGNSEVTVLAGAEGGAFSMIAAT